MAKKTFCFALEGAVHGWGAPSVDSVSNTTEIPEKRGIIGMLACCMGLKREDPRIAKLYEQTDINVTLDEAYRNRMKVLRDFQTINGLPVNPGSSKLISLPTADGKTRSSGLIRYKYYVTDAKYHVTVTAEEELAEELFDAVNDPEWIPYLGRKCCLLSEPIIPVWTA